MKTIFTVIVSFSLIASLQAQLTEEWVARYTGISNSYNEALSIAVDGSGNVYVTGVSYGGDTGEDFATVKYDANGNELWVRRYNGALNGHKTGPYIGWSSRPFWNFDLLAGSNCGQMSFKDTRVGEESFIYYLFGWCFWKKIVKYQSKEYPQSSQAFS